MLLIPCPWCGSRELNEFSFGGEAPGTRPTSPLDVDDLTWTNHLFTSINPRGPGRFLAYHGGGCGQWFSFVLDTVTHETRDPRPPEAAGEIAR